ncbi:MAG: hypothetical protein OEV55_10325 [candidate division Zixibacteria bacterium]|nr:hypothetical protein [candidate division Zixibacteria bacterium]
MLCWSCKKDVEVPEKIGRKEICPNCEADLKCCYNCQLYDKDAYHQCKEPQAEWVRYKEKGNFCEYFEPRTAQDLSPPDKLPDKEELKKKWDSLFKDEG